MTDERSKCKVPDCVLSSWVGNPEGYCIFHDSRIESPASPPPINKVEMRQYILEASNPSQTRPLREKALTIKGIQLGPCAVKMLRSNIERDVKFSECTFPDTEWLDGAQFPNKVSFDLCEFGAPSAEGITVMKGASFNSGVSIKSSSRLKLLQCRLNGENWFAVQRDGTQDEFDPEEAFGRNLFGGERVDLEECLMGLSGCTVALRQPDVDVFDCSMASNDHVTVQLEKGYLRVCKLEAGALLIVKSSFLRITESFLSLGLHIDMRDAKELMCDSITIDKTLNLYGRGPHSEPPQIVLRAVRWRTEQRNPISFRDINLSGYRSDYELMSAPIQLTNVEFKKRFGRVVIAAGAIHRTLKRKGGDLRRYHHANYHFLQAEWFRTFKNYYDDHRDNRMANAFYASELYETWRAGEYMVGRLKGFQRRWLSWESLYWLSSNFGQSALIPLLWLFPVTMIAIPYFDSTGILVGIDRHLSFDKGSELVGRLLAPWFRPEGRETLLPATAFGTFLYFGLVTLTFVLGGLFLLALRRRFKR